MDSTSNEVQKFKILRPNEKLNGLSLESNPALLTGGSGSNSEDFDNSSRIFKSINDVQRFLEVKRSKASTVLDLFTTSLEAQRMRLKSYCERLMFKDPLAYGREAKDILWKKCYYDVINTAKLLRSDSQWQPDELSYRRSKDKGTGSELDHWASSSVYCCLIHLGDLSRYKLDLYPSHSMSLPACYYYQALYWRPASGLPHNQLATLYNAQAVYIDATYHYFRCLNSPKPFEGAVCNLRILADKNRQRMRQNSTADSIPVYKLLVEHFVHLSYTLYYDLPLKPESKEVFVSYLESCLSDMLAVTHHAPCTQWMDQSGECSTLMSYTHIDCTHLLPWIQRAVRRAQDQCLDSRSLMKLMATLFLLSYRSKKHNSKKHGVCLALTYQLMSLLLTATVDKLRQLIAAAEIEPATPGLESGQDKNGGDEDGEEDIKKILGGCRRRMRRRFGSNESLNEDLEHRTSLHKDSHEDSEEEILFDLNLSDDEGDRNLKDKLKLDNEPGSLDEKDDDTGSLTESCFNEKETQGVVLKSFIQLCETESLIQTIRVFVDWLSFDHSVLLFPSPHVETFMRGYASLLNLVSGVHIPVGERNAAQWATTPLSEDWELRGMPPFHHIHAGYQWSELRMNRTSQAAIRLTRLKDFGSLVRSPGVDYLVLDETDGTFKYNETRKVPNGTVDKLSNGGSGDKMNGHVKSILNSSMGNSEDNGVLNLGHHMTQMSNSSSPNHFVDDSDKLGFDSDKIEFGSDEDRNGEDGLGSPHMKNGGSIPYNNNNGTSGNLRLMQDMGQLWLRSEKNGGSIPYNNNNGTSGNLRLMQDMGQLWLRSEVTKLDSQIRHNLSSAMCLPPFLVPDTEVLASSPHLVKQLVYTKKFIIVIPNVVIQELDELKRTSGRVRDTIRWLEVQLRSGNRFLRTQRTTERKEIPFIKYPKKKDKEAWNMYQILELCHHLASRSKPADSESGDQEVTASPGKMVTLLTGHDKNTLQHGVNNVALSAGIDVENITTFYNNWKALCKSPG
ncbi:hypothetical protein M8J76_003891 [Diaphorina citri]|nr:hypothetical protein M8J76_003891 [Diaphorina citri]